MHQLMVDSLHRIMNDNPELIVIFLDALSNMSAAMSDDLLVRALCFWTSCLAERTLSRDASSRAELHHQERAGFHHHRSLGRLARDRALLVADRHRLQLCTGKGCARRKTSCV